MLKKLQDFSEPKDRNNFNSSVSAKDIYKMSQYLHEPYNHIGRSLELEA